ncbi:MAG: SDR family NAD(P)-dependent oxidoreductase [Chitinivibrionia bacterium]|nr:SDR family NAD(P)-dependent oxidoreductase [Chitinivibrionia bacterium]
MQKKVVIITGASGKVGLKILKIFLELDFFVIAHCNKNEKSLQNFVEKNHHYKNFVSVFKADFNTQLPEIYELMQMYKENLHALVNCAANFKKGNLKNVDNLLKITQINDFVPLALSQKFCEIVKKGNIINILDGNIYRFNENYQNYRVSKRFLEEITKEAAILFAPEIRVNAIAFGMLEEEKTPSNSLAKNKEVLKTEISDQNIKQTIEFLISCENLTGQIIYLDNGVHLL